MLFCNVFISRYTSSTLKDYAPIWIGWASICAILGWVLFKVWDALFIPWWPDEVVFYYEVIRQLRLEPTQTFFDIPGTPFMSLSSLVILLWWTAERIFGLTTATNPADFAFENFLQLSLLSAQR